MADERVEKVDEEQEQPSSASGSGEESGKSAGDSTTADKKAAAENGNGEEPGESASASDEADSGTDTNTDTGNGTSAADSSEADTSESDEDLKSEAKEPSAQGLMLEEVLKIRDNFQFIVFHPSHFMGIIIRSYLQDLGFLDIEIVSDLHTFTRALITAVSGLAEKQVVFSVFPHVYKVLRFWLQSDDFSALRKSLPGLLDCPVLVFVEKESEIEDVKEINSRCVIPINESFESNRKRIIEYLEVNSCSKD